MKVTIIYDNKTEKAGLKADWGFSALIEAPDTPKLLFDTGADGPILLSNMEKLNISPRDISIVFISHYHWDHTGGLSGFLDENNDVKLYLPGSVRRRGTFNAKETIPVNSPVQIFDGAYSTGTLGGLEQSLVVETGKGLAIITGCSHPGVRNIYEAASQFGKVSAIIGGIHGFRDFDLVKALDLICPAHCTQYINRIKRLYPGKYTEGGAGRILELS